MSIGLGSDVLSFFDVEVGVYDYAFLYVVKQERRINIFTNSKNFTNA